MNTLERQPDFPKVDLTEKNADFLREFLHSPNLPHTISPENRNGHLEEYLRQFDLVASDSSIEATRALYSTTYDAGRKARISAFEGNNFGFTYGYTLYEIITSLVSPSTFLASDVPTIIATRSLVGALQTQSPQDFINDVKNKLTEEQKITTQLIGEAAAKLYVISTEDAILGAAVKRQLELDSREYTQSLVQ